MTENRYETQNEKRRVVLENEDGDWKLYVSQPTNYGDWRETIVVNLTGTCNNVAFGLQLMEYALNVEPAILYVATP